jgi:multiple sugar transport system substrate-binding protein
MSDAVMKYSRNQKLAKEFLRWIHKKQNYERWFLTQGGYSVGATRVWEDNPMWATVDEPLKIFRTAARNTRLFGYAGPSTAKSTEAFSKYIVTDTYAKSVQGTPPEDAVRWASGELKKIYEG